MRRITLVALAVLPAAALAAAADPTTYRSDLVPTTRPSGVLPPFRGMSDASAAVFLDEHTLLVADDETNALRLYDARRPGTPLATYPMTGFLQTNQVFPEADIEAATRVGDRVYWITSHGRNQDGKLRPNRYRFFATAVRRDGEKWDVRGAGQPYGRLVEAMIASPVLRDLHLDQVTRLDWQAPDAKSLAELAPKKKGLNIEGLAASPDGQTLYIGLRNPRFQDAAAGATRAVLIPLLNAAAVVDRAEPPLFAGPILLDLEGRGVRSIEYSPAHGAYLLVGGWHTGGPGGVLYRWSGRPDERPAPLWRIEDFTPEALAVTPTSRRVLVLSDDGSLMVKARSPAECLDPEDYRDGQCQQKTLRDLNRRTFRAVWLEP